MDYLPMLETISIMAQLRDAVYVQATIKCIVQLLHERSIVCCCPRISRDDKNL